MVVVGWCHLRSREFRDLRDSVSVCLSYGMVGTKARSNVLLGLERFWVIFREAHHGSRFRDQGTQNGGVMQVIWKFLWSWVSRRNLKEETGRGVPYAVGKDLVCEMPGRIWGFLCAEG